MNRLPSVLLFLAASVLVVPVVAFLTDRLRPCRPMEPLAGFGAEAETVTVATDLAAIAPDEIARVTGRHRQFVVTIAGLPDRQQFGGV